MDRFAPAQVAPAEDGGKMQTVGLVHADDVRKRRAEALGAKGAGTTQDGASTPKPSKKKRKVAAGKGKLSFGLDDEEGESTPAVDSESDGAGLAKKKLVANSKVDMKPRVLTKSALQRDAQQAEQARQEFIVMREAVKQTEVVIPFVFYDGTNTPGGRCRIKKGEHIWLFLDKARKVGAELGVGGGDRSRREWARVSVDDLMLVRGEVILPQHYDLYYFLFNKVRGFHGAIFDYSAQPTKGTPSAEEDADAAHFNPLARAGEGKEKISGLPDEELEGFGDDPTITKVVDRRWYEQNKHIFPASIWEEYRPEKNLAQAQRKDANGNLFFS
ncbi:hypothetical protein P280DRAFT_405585 [Massarina eburnea CBS 473.64]|uniref:FAM50A/XAP5 C-terminal domain-containing protein n=1 Tax=Massarina eburnea CBS 473.64 TaxID=1395130 RepID=A0A6A6RVU9_9PLEO|nr:hypothetical protein P280DRAFT_405585 [Massarina eburnea CBS 473.64]